MSIVNRNPDLVILPSGHRVIGSLRTIDESLPFKQLPAIELLQAPDATHVLMMRSISIKPGDALTISGDHYKVMRVYDPYGKSGMRPALGSLGKTAPQKEAHPQSGRWTACLVREK